MADIDLNATITSRLDLGPDLMVLRVVPNGWDIPDFKAGQFAVLGLPGAAARCRGAFPEKEFPDSHKFIRRAYSIASSPLNKFYIEFYITLVKEGALTPRLWNLTMADRLYMSPKITGQFVMDDIPEDQNVVLIATGTGLAPFVSMIQTHLKADSKRRFTIIHGVRQSQDLAYRSFFMGLRHICPNFSYFPIISRERDDPVPWQGPVGRVQAIWDGKLIEKNWGFAPTPENTHIFMCGHPQMITDMTEQLITEGYKEDKRGDPGQIHVEKYW